MELMKKDFSKIQDKLEQTEADLRRVTREKEQLNSDLSTAAKLKDNDVDKLELEITQFNTERDQLVRQLEKSQDMLLSFQQGELKIIFEPKVRAECSVKCFKIHFWPKISSKHSMT